MTSFFPFLLLSLLCITCSSSVPEQATKITNEAPTVSFDTLPLNPLGNTIASRIVTPPNFERPLLDTTSFGYYLRHFPLKASGSPVLLFDGNPKWNQEVHAAVLDIDTGQRDLQQCADAVMRLRAEHLWAQQNYDEIAFNFTNGFPAEYRKWRNGQRIVVDGNQVYWRNSSQANGTYLSFRKYLNMVFGYAGTQSLSQELSPKTISDIQAGDVFIKGGFPGHAILVVDHAVHPDTKEVLVLLAQSYMPAQDIHVLKNPNREDISPWYAISDMKSEIKTPEWTFTSDQLKRFE